MREASEIAVRGPELRNTVEQAEGRYVRIVDGAPANVRAERQVSRCSKYACALSQQDEVRISEEFIDLSDGNSHWRGRRKRRG